MEFLVDTILDLQDGTGKCKGKQSNIIGFRGPKNGINFGKSQWNIFCTYKNKFDKSEEEKEI